jgi:hypothetical protein
VSELCHIPLETPGQHSDLGDTPKQIDVAGSR